MILAWPSLSYGEPPSLAAQEIAAARPKRIVREYALISAAAREGYADPRNWRLLASNDDGQNWQVLDEQTNQVFRSRLQRRVYHISNNQGYQTYRLEVEGVNSVQLAEWELIGPLVGVTNEAEVQIQATSSKEHPLLGAASQAFDNDPTTRWLDFGTGQNSCWLQCQYSLQSQAVVSNLAQFVLWKQRLASSRPLVAHAPQILAAFTNQTMRVRRQIIGYALTSANDMPSRDPRDWRLLGSNDQGETWDTVDVRQNEMFQQRFQRRVFALAKPARYSEYRLQIDCVRVPWGLPSGANCVQVAEIEPLYSTKDHVEASAILVSAEGENPPLETVEAAFDGRANTKWLSFTEDDNTNRSSWVQWEYLADTEPAILNLRWVKALQARKPMPVHLSLGGVVVSWDPQAKLVGILDPTGFEQFDLPGSAAQPRLGERVRLTGRLDPGQEIPAVFQAQLTSLAAAAAPEPIQVGESVAANRDFISGTIEARVASVSDQSAAWITLGLVSEADSERMVAKVCNPSRTVRFFPGSHVRLDGVVQAVLQEDGRRAAGIVWVADMDHVTFLATTEKDWMEWPRYTLARLNRPNIRDLLGHAVRVVGTALAQDTDSVLIADQATNRLRVYYTGSVPPLTGSAIEAAGFLARQNQAPVLHSAHVRLTAAPVTPQTRPQATAGAGAVFEPIANIHDIYKRLEEQPGKSFPVHIRGVITYIDLTFDTFCVQDGTEGIVVLNQIEAGLAPRLKKEGSYVEVRGTVDPEQQAIIPNGFVTLLGRGRMPEPRHHSWEYLLTGKDDAQWVQIEGMVSACGDGGLTLIVTGGRLAVVINEFAQRNQDRLLGSLVRISGVCSPMRDSRNRRLGIQLLVPSQEYIEVIRPAPENPFELPTSKIGELAASSSRGTNWNLRLVKAAGVVTYQEPHSLFLQNDKDGVRVLLRAESPVQVGDRIEAVGFAEPDGFSPKLVQAVVRKVGEEPLPAPAPLDLMGADLSEQDVTRVQIEGTVVGLSSRKSMQVLELNDPKSDKTFSAFIPHTGEDLSSIPIGSGVRLIGVFRSETEMMPDLGVVPTSFQMYLNSPRDITVLHRPSWWTASHTARVAGGLGAILLMALGWAWSLRKTVRQRTEQLRIEILDHQKTEEALETSERFMRSLVESLPQNILRKDREGRFTFANQFFGRTIGKSMEQIIGKTDFDLFPGELAAKFRRDDAQVIATGNPLDTVEESRNASGENIYVQVIKTPLLDADGRVIGLQVVFWDVTERKRAEARLEAAQKAMIDASRQAGMAEVAAGVLHNVGNVLNSVNVSANLVSDNLQKSKTPGLSKAVALLREHEADLGGFFAKDPRARQLTAYLAKLAECLNSEQDSAKHELQTLRKNIEHIKEIVAMQQNYAKIIGVTEKVQVTDLVEDALRLNAGTLERHEIELTREYEPHVPQIVVERHKVLQILVNLIRNAKYACDESGRRDKRLTVRVAATSEFVQICTLDNGVGIAPENLNRIFNHGFTTRKDGHGFGLHSGALAAKEMGGTLIAQSEGPGRGACFTLTLPLNP